MLAVALLEVAPVTESEFGETDTAGRLTRLMDTGTAMLAWWPAESETVQRAVPDSEPPAAIPVPVKEVLALDGELMTIPLPPDCQLHE